MLIFLFLIFNFSSKQCTSVTYSGVEWSGVDEVEWSVLIASVGRNVNVNRNRIGTDAMQIQSNE